MSQLYKIQQSKPQKAGKAREYEESKNIMIFYFVNQQERQNLSKYFFMPSKGHKKEHLLVSKRNLGTVKLREEEFLQLMSDQDLSDKEKTYLAGLLYEKEDFPFEFSVRKSQRNPFGLIVELNFVYGSDPSSEKLIQKLTTLFGVGKIKRGSKGWVYRQANRRLMEEKVMPFFRDYKLANVTGRHEEAFRVCGEILRMISNGEHRNRKGLLKILELGCRYQERELKGKGRQQKTYEEWLKYMIAFQKASRSKQKRDKKKEQREYGSSEALRLVMLDLF